jgi:hypothetical protein
VKPESVTTGKLEVGVFEIIISRPVFREEATEDLKFFQVLVHRKEDNLLLYVNLAEEEGFAIFQHLQVFSRKLTEIDLVEYNARVSSVFHKIGMPSYLLSRHTIAGLFDTCQTLSKKIKKNHENRTRAIRDGGQSSAQAE